MRIEITLKNPDYCDGCPLLRFKTLGIGAYCMYFREEGWKNKDMGWEAEVLEYQAKRPEICIKENGR